ncbi:LysM peptidoglycan-binding domain-containing protein [Psychrobacillus sp. OK032]|uniref:LysM peptidoglycan-binding domain-containing protein n=1 Tax=Psychrobacillus sp. OK032 TaxID=1884358 RepID=UPI0008C13D0B|nr:LysM peptidoglycan-binding domain-containing protein [Psychrobacillus sp. OK032]SES33981.1 LysM domain-containing protein [Psychrobacillus sp. OK032]
MNQDDYQKKIDEHRQSIGVEEEKVELRSRRRSNSGKKAKKKSRNILIPTLFCIFILLPVCIFLYVQFIYTPKDTEEVQESGIIQVETKTITNSPKEEEEKDENTASAEDKEVEEQAPVKEEPKVEEPKAEQPKVEEPKVEQPKQEAPTRTHIVKENETLYRIAVNYYKDPNAVEKIKSANGLSSNAISAGQKLILP